MPGEVLADHQLLFAKYFEMSTKVGLIMREKEKSAKSYLRMRSFDEVDDKSSLKRRLKIRKEFRIKQKKEFQLKQSSLS